MIDIQISRVETMSTGDLNPVDNINVANELLIS